MPVLPEATKEVLKKMGRPTKLTPELLAKAGGYLEYMRDKTMTRYFNGKAGVVAQEIPEPPTLVGLAQYIDVSRETMYLWSKDSSDFFDILSRVKEAGEQSLAKNGLSDTYNAGLAKFLLSADHDKREKNDVDIKSDGKPIFVPSDILRKHGVDGAPADDRK